MLQSNCSATFSGWEMSYACRPSASSESFGSLPALPHGQPFLPAHGGKDRNFFVHCHFKELNRSSVNGTKGSVSPWSSAFYTPASPRPAAGMTIFRPWIHVMFCLGPSSMATLMDFSTSRTMPARRWDYSIKRDDSPRWHRISLACSFTSDAGCSGIGSSSLASMPQHQRSD